MLDGGESMGNVKDSTDKQQAADLDGEHARQRAAIQVEVLRNVELSAEVKALQAELQESEQQSAQARLDLDTRDECHHQYTATLQTKTREVIQRLRTQADERVSELSSELSEARSEATYMRAGLTEELDSARTECAGMWAAMPTDATESEVRLCSTERELAEARHELVGLHQRTMSVENESEHKVQSAVEEARCEAEGACQAHAAGEQHIAELCGQVVSLEGENAALQEEIQMEVQCSTVAYVDSSGSLAEAEGLANSLRAELRSVADEHLQDAAALQVERVRNSELCTKADMLSAEVQDSEQELMQARTGIAKTEESHLHDTSTLREQMLEAAHRMRGELEESQHELSTEWGARVEEVNALSVASIAEGEESKMRVDELELALVETRRASDELHARLASGECGIASYMDGATGQLRQEYEQASQAEAVIAKRAGDLQERLASAEEEGTAVANTLTQELVAAEELATARSLSDREANVVVLEQSAQARCEVPSLIDEVRELRDEQEHLTASLVTERCEHTEILSRADMLVEELMSMEESKARAQELEKALIETRRGADELRTQIASAEGEIESCLEAATVQFRQEYDDASQAEVIIGQRAIALQEQLASVEEEGAAAAATFTCELVAAEEAVTSRNFSDQEADAMVREELVQARDEVRSLVHEVCELRDEGVNLRTSLSTAQCERTGMLSRADELVDELRLMQEFKTRTHELEQALVESRHGADVMRAHITTEEVETESRVTASTLQLRQEFHEVARTESVIGKRAGALHERLASMEEEAGAQADMLRGELLSAEEASAACEANSREEEVAVGEKLIEARGELFSIARELHELRDEHMHLSASLVKERSENAEMSSRADVMVDELGSMVDSKARVQEVEQVLVEVRSGSDELRARLASMECDAASCLEAATARLRHEFGEASKDEAISRQRAGALHERLTSLEQEAVAEAEMLRRELAIAEEALATRGSNALESEAAVAERLVEARGEACSLMDELGALRNEHVHLKTSCEAERCESVERSLRVDALLGELTSTEVQLASVQDELGVQKEVQRQELAAIQDKTRGVVNRIREQGEERASALAAELQDAQRAADGELASARGEADKAAAAALAAREEEATSLQAALAGVQVELRISQDRCRRTERELEQAGVECQELLKTTSKHDGNAHSRLEGKIYSLQQQLDCSRGDHQAAHRKTADLTMELTAANAQTVDLHIVAARREEECRMMRLSSETCEGNLQGEILHLREVLAISEAKSYEAEEAAAHAAASVDTQVAEALAVVGGRTQELDDAVTKTTMAEGSVSELERELAQLREEAKERAAHMSSAAMHDAEWALQREAHEAELARLREEAGASKSSSESHRQLVHALQQHLAEQEQRADRAERELEEGRRELQDTRQQSQTTTPDLDDIELAQCEPPPKVVDEARGVLDFDFGCIVKEEGLQASPPENTTCEAVSALYDRIDRLQWQCNTYKKQLDARPIMCEAPGYDEDEESLGPLARVGQGGARRSRPSWEAVLRRAVGPLARRVGLPDGWEQRLGDLAVQPIVGCVEQALRKFTQRLLRRNAWLWLFYAHILVLYAIIASCIAATTTAAGMPDSAADGIHMQQATQHPPSAEG